MRPARFWLWEALFALLACSALLPLFAFHYVPSQDLPQHVAAVRVLHDFDAAGARFPELFEVSRFSTPYWSVYALAGLLAYAVGPLFGVKAVLGLSIAALPYSVRALLRALGKPSGYALLALPFGYSAHTLLGFLNFVAALPLMVFGLSLAVRIQRGASRKVQLAFAVLACLTFYTHVAPYLVLVAGSSLWFLERDLRVSVRRARWLLPSLLLAVLWLLLQQSGRVLVGLDAPEGPAAAGAEFQSVAGAIEHLPLWLTDVLREPWGRFCLLGFVAIAVLTGVLGPLRNTVQTEWRLRCLLLALVLAYFVLPASYQWVWPINGRVPVIVALLAVAALPAVSARSAKLVATLAGALWFFWLCAVGQAFRGTDAEYAGLEQVLRSIPEGRKVAGLIFRPTSAHVRFAPFLHAAQWYQAERGGAAMFSFASMPHSPFHFRPEQHAPALPPRWEWQPHRVAPERDLAWFDYVLSRGAPAELSGWSKLSEANGWAVWGHSNDAATEAPRIPAIAPSETTIGSL